MKEIVFISGKGGTGKTSLMASVIPRLPKSIIADCDVDAPDLHILLEPTNLSREDYFGMKKARIDPEVCIDCGHCRAYCNFEAIVEGTDSDGVPTGAPSVRNCLCEGCGVCAQVCPVGAITMEDTVAGTLSYSATSYGPLVHARLNPGEETSGKLVFAVREKSRELAKKFSAGYILVDGSPGIGCSVISSLTNADQAVVVTEPSLAAYHDLLRILELTGQLSIPVTVVINKYDISAEITGRIENHCRENHLSIGMKIPFNEDMIGAITDRKIPSEALPEFFRENGFPQLIETLI
jgi:MinD superfamily P-loop ATPase